jgi:hypothetical protein
MRADHEDGKIVSNSFGEDGTPAILLSADISGPAIERAYAAGYRAVVGLPVQPRVLYRRNGSILQMARRSGRKVEPDHVGAELGMAGFAEPVSSRHSRRS